nr:blue copper protein-like [Ipomoea batatas]GME12604.1 blue copper protein-like [Ipomoea batatas]
MASSSATKFLCLFLILGLASPILATDYYVGGDKGWNLDVDFKAWVSDKVFKVGDVLHFIYVPLVHNVGRLVDEAAFLNCLTDPKLIIDASGSTSVVLNEVGDFYFCSSVLLDCVSNLKIKITVSLS